MYPSIDLYFIEKYQNLVNVQNNNVQTMNSESRWIKLARKYENWPFAIFIKPFEPLGVLIAAIALVFAVIALKEERVLRKETLDVMKEEKSLRKVVLFSTLAERLEAARKSDQSKKSEDLDSRAGHIKILELIVELDKAERIESAKNESDPSKENCKNKIPIVDRKEEFSLKYINASKVNFYIHELKNGIDLRDADIRSIDFEDSNLEAALLINAYLSNAILKGTNLKEAELVCTTLTEACLESANLVGATLTDADLIRTDLTDADLMEADLTDADLAGAEFTDADLTRTDLQFAKNLSQNQLDSACADPDSDPIVPKNLKWVPRECPEGDTNTKSRSPRRSFVCPVGFE